MNIDVKNILIGAIVALLFYFIAIWLLGMIALAIPSIIVSLIAVVIFLAFAFGKVNI